MTKEPPIFKLHWLFLFGIHKGKTLEWAIENDLDYVTDLYRKKIIERDDLAWREYLVKLKEKKPYMQKRIGL